VKIIEALRQEAEKLQKQADALKQAAELLNGSMNGSTSKRKYSIHRKKHQMSAAGRRAISIAQKKRWAAAKQICSIVGFWPGFFRNLVRNSENHEA